MCISLKFAFKKKKAPPLSLGCGPTLPFSRGGGMKALTGHAQALSQNTVHQPTRNHKVSQKRWALAQCGRTALGPSPPCPSSGLRAPELRYRLLPSSWGPVDPGSPGAHSGRTACCFSPGLAGHPHEKEPAHQICTRSSGWWAYCQGLPNGPGAASTDGNTIKGRDPS